MWLKEYAINLNLAMKLPVLPTDDVTFISVWLQRHMTVKWDVIRKEHRLYWTFCFAFFYNFLTLPTSGPLFQNHGQPFYLCSLGLPGYTNSKTCSIDPALLIPTLYIQYPPTAYGCVHTASAAHILNISIGPYWLNRYQKSVILTITRLISIDITQHGIG